MKLKKLIENTIKVGEVKFSKSELLHVFKYFLDRLVKDHGNDRDEMIKFHIDKLVGLPYSQLVKKMPRGPKGRWEDLMFDIRGELKDLAEKKVSQVNEMKLLKGLEESVITRTDLKKDEKKAKMGEKAVDLKPYLDKIKAAKSLEDKKTLSKEMAQHFKVGGKENFIQKIERAKTPGEVDWISYQAALAGEGKKVIK